MKYPKIYYLPVRLKEENLTLSLLEMQILDWRCLGLKDREVAAKLFMGVRTLEKIMHKALNRNLLSSKQLLVKYLPAHHRRVFKLEVLKNRTFLLGPIKKVSNEEAFFS